MSDTEAPRGEAARTGRGDDRGDAPERSARSLLPQHQARLDASSIAPEVAAMRGYFSAKRRRDLEAFGFQGRQAQLVPSLVIPIFDVRGQVAIHQLRPDTPREKNGKRIKYETKAGVRMVIDVPPGARAGLAHPSVPLFITEGALKADAAVSQGLCCIALLGVWNWRGKNELGGTLALACWEQIPLNDGRIVFIAFDSDVMVKKEVGQALRRLGTFLTGRGAQVHYLYLPAARDGSKQGLDDFFAAGHTVEQLLQCASTELRGMRQRTDASDHAPPYAVVEGRIVLEKQTKDGVVDAPLCNFDARIVAEEVHDDGVETMTRYRIEGSLPGGERLRALEVPAERFPAMQWVAEWGNAAVVFAGASTRDHVRTGVQLLSGPVPRTTRFTHLGWRHLGESDVYLHAGGAIGADGPVEGIAVLPPDELRRFVLPAPPTGEALREAVCASLALIEVAKDAVTVPVMSAVYRSVLGPADFTLHVAGFTGVFKTEIATLGQQHFGPEMNSRRLPGSWSSTGNSLEVLAFHAKDALLVVDDYAPSGTSSDVARMQREAERLLRAQGNRSGRMRLRADATLRPVKAPRGLLLSTGEDIPGSQSVRARLVVVDVRKDDVHVERLTAAQAAADQYAAAMAGFVAWLASRLGIASDRLRESVGEWRTRPLAHRRYADTLGQLSASFNLFVDFAVETGSISHGEATVLRRRAEEALFEVAAAQTAYQRAADPVSRFLELVTAALVSGAAHLADASDETAPPWPTPERWGWQAIETTKNNGPDGSQIRVRPQGRRMGWIRSEEVFLEPTVAFAEAQRLAQLQGTPLAIRPETLWGRMAERGLLVSHQAGRFTAQPRIGGRQHRALHLRADLFTSGSGVCGVDGVEGREGEPETLPDTTNGTTQRDPHGVTHGVRARARAFPGPPDTADTGDTTCGRGVGPGESAGVVSDPDGMEVL